MNLASVKVLKILNGVNSNVERSPWEKKSCGQSSYKVFNKLDTFSFNTYQSKMPRIDLKVFKFVFSFDVPIKKFAEHVTSKDCFNFGICLSSFTSMTPLVIILCCINDCSCFVCLIGS